MSGKRKRNDGLDNFNDGDTRTNQSLPVAELGPDFDGIPLDGAQYLAVVRQESHTVPAICYVANPYAKNENFVATTLLNSISGTPTSACMPSEEWRRRFLTRFSNMRETLANRSKQNLSTYPEKIPRGRNGKKWYRFLHGRDLIEDVEYDDEQDDEDLEVERVEKEPEMIVFNCREPSELLLHHFSTPRIISLLAVLPYWLTQPHVSPEESQHQAIDPFHSRWLFALLAHVDSQLVGDDVSVLRILARACIACIVQSRIHSNSSNSKDQAQEEDILKDELGAWMIICAIAGIWAQHDLWQDARDNLEQCARLRQPLL